MSQLLMTRAEGRKFHVSLRNRMPYRNPTLGNKILVLTSTSVCQPRLAYQHHSFGGKNMTMEPTPTRKTPWFAIVLGGLAVLCLCAIVVCLAILAYFIPIRSSTTFLETSSVVIRETETVQPTAIPSAAFGFRTLLWE